MFIINADKFIIFHPKVYETCNLAHCLSTLLLFEHTVNIKSKKNYSFYIFIELSYMTKNNIHFIDFMVDDWVLY